MILAGAGQIGMVWGGDQKSWIVPIPGTTKLSRLLENLGATEIVLKDDELKDLNETLSKIEISGDRYPAPLQKRMGK